MRGIKIQLEEGEIFVTYRVFRVSALAAAADSPRSWQEFFWRACWFLLSETENNQKKRKVKDPG